MFHLNRELYENIWNINKNRTTTENTQKQHHHQHSYPSLHTQPASATISSTSNKETKINFNEKILYYKQYSAQFYFIFLIFSFSVGFVDFSIFPMFYFDFELDIKPIFVFSYCFLCLHLFGFHEKWSLSLFSHSPMFPIDRERGLHKIISFNTTRILY